MWCTPLRADALAAAGNRWPPWASNWPQNLWREFALSKPAPLQPDANLKEPESAPATQQASRPSSAASSTSLASSSARPGDPASTQFGQEDLLFAQSGASIPPAPGVALPRVHRSLKARLIHGLTLPWLGLKSAAGVLRYLVRRWIRHHPGEVSRVLETALWPALFVALAWYSNAGNPFYIDEGFPWPWLGPWLIGLRYGVVYGAAASVGLWASWVVLTQWLGYTMDQVVAQPTQFPRLYFLGGAIATVIAGEFGSYWRMQITRLQESKNFLNDKVERLTRRLYLIKLSHDELEYEMVDRPGTLRESLIELRILMDRYTREHPLEVNALPGAQYMLDFVMQQCRIDSAVMYSVRMEPVLKLTRVASAGGMPDPALTTR